MSYTYLQEQGEESLAECFSDISSAGKGEGITGKRSGLWKEFGRIIGEIRPRFVFVENSPTLRTRGLHTVLNDLAKMGYDAKWGVVGAINAGAPHHRKRLWILAYPSKSGLQRGLRKQQNQPKECSMENMEPRKIRNWLDIPEPYGLRNFNGIPNGNDRIKALGNAQVPIVAATAWRILSTNNRTEVKGETV